MPATYEAIATTTLGSASSSIDFTSIASSYTDLRLVIVTRQEAGSATPIRLRFNSDTGTNYSHTELSGSGTTASSTRSTSVTYIEAGRTRNVANVWNLTTVDIFSYAGSTNKTVLTTDSADSNGSGFVWRRVGLWSSTSAITSISVSLNTGNLQSGTTATLYGILKA